MAFRSRGAHFLLGRDRRDRAPGWGSCTQPPALHLVHFAQISGLTPKSGDLFFLLLQSLWDAMLHRGLVPVIHPNTSGSSSPPGTTPLWPLSHLFPFPPSPPAPPGGLGGGSGAPTVAPGVANGEKSQLSSAAPQLRSAAGSELSVGSCTTPVLQHPGTGG